MAGLKDKSSVQVGNTFMRILSTAVLPEILQSDNRKKFLGYCIKMVKEEFHTIEVVEGHPASQGMKIRKKKRKTPVGHKLVSM